MLFTLGRRSALAVNGIIAAADVARFRRLPYEVVSKVAEYELLDWCRNLANSFKQDPADPHDATEIAKLDRSTAEQQHYMLAPLREGPALLSRKKAEIRAARDRMKPTLDAAGKSLRAARRRAGLRDLDRG